MNDVYSTEATGILEEVVETDNVPPAIKNVPIADILEEVDTEISTEFTSVLPSTISKDDTEILESVSNPNRTQPTYTETVVVQAAEGNKPFENSGYEVAVVLCLSIIIGIVVFDILTKRWFT